MKQKYLQPFCKYILKAQEKFVVSLASSNTQSNLSAEKVSNFKVPVPPLNEQQAIADYLDKKCAELDCEIASKQKQIELLEELKQTIITDAVTRGIDKSVELKTSHANYLGNIPVHWEVMQLKRVCRKEKYNIKTGPFGTQLKGDDLQLEGDVKVYNQRNVIDGQFEDVQYFVKRQKAKELANFYTKPLDVLVTSRGTIGKAHILPVNSEMGILHPCLIALRIDAHMFDARLLVYMFNDSRLFKDYLNLKSNATTIDVIYTDTLKSMYLPVAPIQEQYAIVAYLDIQTAKIDSQIAAQQKQIELINELKQSIVSQAVTGKIKI